MEERREFVAFSRVSFFPGVSAYISIYLPCLRVILIPSSFESFPQQSERTRRVFLVPVSDGQRPLRFDFLLVHYHFRSALQRFPTPR